MPDPWFRYGITRPFATPLRLGLLADHDSTLPAWASQTVRMLLDSGVAELVLIAVPSHRRRRRPAGAILAHPAWSIARATIWRSRSSRPARTEGFLSPDGRVVRVAVERTGDRSTRLAPADVARIREARLDVLLRFGPGPLQGEILDAARFGMWSFQHSDERRYRGQPVAFWELFDQSSEIGVVLQRDGHDPNEPLVLRRAMLATEPHSYRVTLDRVHRAGTDLPLQVCRDLLAGRDLPTERLTHRAPDRPPPDWREVAHVLGSTMVANVRRLLYGAFMLKQWSIGRLRGGPQRVVDGRLDGAQWLRPSGRTRMLADPMIVPGSAGRVVLCEAQDFAVGRGVIIRVEVGDHDGHGRAPWLAAKRIRTIVELPVHLSFPTVVRSHEGLVLIPEAATSGGLLSACLDDEVTVASDFESAPGLAAVDPVVFRHGDRWWLACTERGPSARSHLWLFHGPGVRGPWTAHPRNPVVIDAGCARAAGLPFVHAGRLYRPGQDGRLGYGRSIRVMRVLTLTPEDYAEELAAEIGPDPSSPFGLGVHTVSVDGDTIWIDGYRAVIHPLAGWFRMRARRSPEVMVGRRVDGWAP